MGAKLGLSSCNADLCADLSRADTSTEPLHHTIFAQARGTMRDGRVHVPVHWNGNLRAYGELIEGTTVVIPEDDRVGNELIVPLDQSLEPILLRGFSSGSLIKRILAYSKARSTIRSLVARSSFVQLQHVSSVGFLAGAAAIDSGTPFYLDMGGKLRAPPGVRERLALRSRLSRLYYSGVEKKLAANARLIIAVNDYLHHTFLPNDAPKAVVTHSMIKEEDIYRRDDACSGEAVQLFVAARMIKPKGIDDLIRAVKSLRDGGLDVSLKVAGTGAYLPDLQLLAKELGLQEAVDFLGGIPGGDQLWAYYRKADIAVLPSRMDEGTPRMIIESWAAGAPVVATTVGGIPTLVKQECEGLLVPPSDVAALCTAIRRIKTDSALRSRLVSSGYDRVSDMTYDGRLVLLRRAFSEHLPGLLRD